MDNKGEAYSVYLTEKCENRPAKSANANLPPNPSFSRHGQGSRYTEQGVMGGQFGHYRTSMMRYLNIPTYKICYTSLDPLQSDVGVSIRSRENKKTASLSLYKLYEYSHFYFRENDGLSGLHLSSKFKLKKYIPFGAF